MLIKPSNVEMSFMYYIYAVHNCTYIFIVCHLWHSKIQQGILTNCSQSRLKFEDKCIVMEIMTERSV